jgi:hypothetical protein
MRLVSAKVATLSEIRNTWTVRQVFEYNELLDLQDEAELKAAEARKDAIEAARA